MERVSLDNRARQPPCRGHSSGAILRPMLVYESVCQLKGRRRCSPRRDQRRARLPKDRKRQFTADEFTADEFTAFRIAKFLWATPKIVRPQSRADTIHRSARGVDTPESTKHNPSGRKPPQPLSMAAAAACLLDRCVKLIRIAHACTTMWPSLSAFTPASPPLRPRCSDQLCCRHLLTARD